MTLKKSWVSRTVRALKIGASGIALLATAGGLTAGCLDRPVAPATPRTSNVVVKTVTQSGVNKIDLLFMIDNSISMADKQEILAEAVPVLVQRLVDPICVDDDGDPTGDDSSQDGCGGGTHRPSSRRSRTSTSASSPRASETTAATCASPWARCRRAR